LRCSYCTGCCLNCSDCELCSNCDYCKGCSWCVGCSECIGCSYSVDCSNCIGVGNGHGLQYVAYSFQCTAEQYECFLKKYREMSATPSRGQGRAK
jgi:hypothetical protein